MNFVKGDRVQGANNHVIIGRERGVVIAFDTDGDPVVKFENPIVADYHGWASVKDDFTLAVHAAFLEFVPALELLAEAAE